MNKLEETLLEEKKLVWSKLLGGYVDEGQTTGFIMPYCNLIHPLKKPLPIRKWNPQLETSPHSVWAEIFDKMSENPSDMIGLVFTGNLIDAVRSKRETEYYVDDIFPMLSVDNKTRWDALILTLKELP